MKWRLLVCIMLIVLCCSGAYALPFTMTFDDIPAGGNLAYYYDIYGVILSGGEVVDHSASSWGLPQSGTNVMVWDGNPWYDIFLQFGSDPADYPGAKFLPYSVRSVRAYFGTEPGAVLKTEGYRQNGTVAATAFMGASDESWSNRYVEIGSAAGDIAFVHIYGARTANPQLYFSIDDMTIVPVPEPSSVLALLGGLGSLGVSVRARRR